MLYDDFYDELSARLTRQRAEARASIELAAELVVASLVRGNKSFAFGSGHSALITQDVSVRAGSLAIFNPIFVPGLLATDHPYLRAGLMERISGIAAAVLATSAVKAGDTLIVISNSGRNHVPIEMAVDARARGMSIIAVTGLETASTESSRHPSGKHLHELADVTIDTCTPKGDGSIPVPGTPAKLGPLSTILGAAALHALSAAVAESLAARGTVPPVLISGNVDGGDAYSIEVLEKYRSLTTYLDGIETASLAAAAGSR